VLEIKISFGEIKNVILNQITMTSCHKPARHCWSLFMAGGSTNTQNITLYTILWEKIEQLS
jgi:hypothetical protein